MMTGGEPCNTCNDGGNDITRGGGLRMWCSSGGGDIKSGGHNSGRCGSRLPVSVVMLEDVSEVILSLIVIGVVNCIACTKWFSLWCCIWQ